MSASRHDKLKRFLAEEVETATDARRPTVIEKPGAASPLPLGRKLGRYTLLEVLGEGGMGVVFRAHDGELGREVAIKMLKTAQAYSETEVERFQREARHTAQLQHPGIATLHEAGRDGDVLYLVLELVRGEAFDPRRGELYERVGLLEKVARAVQHAHARGILHRDLKPGNILVDARGEPKLLDFGLSRGFEEAGKLTRTGAFFGTPHYSAPEQAEGRVRDIDARTDIYALGAILYEILAGEAPASGATLAEILRKVSLEDPARPPGPADLVNVCLKAIEKDPGRRYPSVETFADDLGCWRRGEAVVAKPPSTFAKVRRALVRRRTVLVPAGLLALVLALWMSRELHRGPERLLLDDFQTTPQGWKFVDGKEFPGAKGSLEVVDGAYRLEVDLTQGAYVGAWRDLPDLEGRDVKELRLRVKAAGVAKLMVRFEDSTRQAHQSRVFLAPGEGWQDLVISRAQILGVEHWGGKNDGRWHGPARAFGLHVGKEDFPEGAPRKAVVWFDDLEWVPERLNKE